MPFLVPTVVTVSAELALLLTVSPCHQPCQLSRASRSGDTPGMARITLGEQLRQVKRAQSESKSEDTAP